MWFIASRLLLIAQPFSYRIAPYLSAAEKLSLDVVIASRGEFSLVSEVHQGIHVDFDDIELALDQILEFAQHKPFVGVLGCDDSTVELAAKAAALLNLPHNPAAAARLSSRKDLARAHLARAGCKIPNHRLIDLKLPLAGQVQNFVWPIVIKPLNLSGSRGVIRADDINQYEQACRRIEKIILDNQNEYLRSHLIVEQYIEGVEVTYEGYLSAGKLNSLAIFDKPDPLQGPFFEETIYVTPSTLSGDKLLQIQQSVTDACRAYGLVTGPIHAELRVNEQGAWILEVASRTIGGECARVLDNGLAYGLETLTIALAIGQPVSVDMPELARGVMMMPIAKAGMLRRVEGLSKARAIANIDNVDIVIREGNELIQLPEGNQYPGYIFASAEYPEDVITALRQAFSCLDFILAPVFKMTHTR